MENDPFGGFLGKAFEGAKQAAADIGMRIVVHATAVAACLLGASRYGFSFWSYIGLICLVPRGISLTAPWVLPSATGAAQTVMLIMQGMSPGAAVFFGGFQTWLQRVFDKKGRIGREWVMAPILCLGLGFVSVDIPFVTFGLFAVAGAAVQTLYGFFRLTPMLRGRLGNLHKALRLRLEDKGLPVPLSAPLRRLVGQLESYHTRCRRPGKESLPLIEAGDDILAQLLRLKHRPQPESWDASAGKTFVAVDKLNEALHSRLAALGPLPVGNGAALDPLDRFYATALELSGKREKVPASMHRHLDGILAGTERLLHLMRNDAADVAPGTRFLNRYLPAAHRVVDEFARLTATGKEQASLLTQTEETLDRLEKAFAAEHDRLLANDAMSLSAELKVLDKLLQMEGK